MQPMSCTPFMPCSPRGHRDFCDAHYGVASHEFGEFRLAQVFDGDVLVLVQSNAVKKVLKTGIRMQAVKL